MVDDGGTGRRVIGGRYRLDRLIGHGGMGVLWAGFDSRLQRPVAVKQVTPPGHLSPAEREQISQRVLREAQAAARTGHPSAITVYDIVQQDDGPWIVMQLLSPWSLADIVNGRGPLAPAAAARLGLDLLDAIVAGNRAGVLHGDVKPSNVLFRDGRAVLIDFGIAALDDEAALAHDDTVLGSPAFLPPERARGGLPTLAGDLWSLGATLYASVEGRSPFQRSNALATLAAVLTENPPLAEHAGPLGTVIGALLAPDPEDRPTPNEARTLLLQALQATSGDPPLTGPGLEDRRPRPETADPATVRLPTRPATILGRSRNHVVVVLVAVVILVVAIPTLALVMARGTAAPVVSAATPLDQPKPSVAVRAHTRTASTSRAPTDAGGTRRTAPPTTTGIVSRRSAPSRADARLSSAGLSVQPAKEQPASSGPRANKSGASDGSHGRDDDGNQDSQSNQGNQRNENDQGDQGDQGS